MNSRLILRVSLFFGALLSYLALLLFILADSDKVVFRPSTPNMFASLAFIGATFFWAIYIISLVVIPIAARVTRRKSK